MTRSTRQPIKRMLDICDELGRLRRKIHGMEKAGSERSLPVLKAREEELRQDLGRLQLKGSLGEVARHAGMDGTDLLILASLLRHYLRAEQPFIEGRSLLNQLFHSSFEVFAGVHRLIPDSPLSRAGLIELEDEDRTDILEQGFRVTEKAVALLVEDLEGRPGTARRQSRSGYSYHAEYLADMKALVDLHMARSNQTFPWEEQVNLRDPSWNPGAPFTRRIHRRLLFIQERLRRTSPEVSMPFVLFAERQDLSQEEQILVLALLFHELHEGSSQMELVDLLPLVATCEADLVQSRRFFWQRGRLRRLGILELECPPGERLFASEARLAGWVVDLLLGEEQADAPVTADDRLDFHLFLKKLEREGD